MGGGADGSHAEAQVIHLEASTASLELGDGTQISADLGRIRLRPVIFRVIAAGGGFQRGTVRPVTADGMLRVT